MGSRETDPNGILDVVHAAAQGIVSGANMVLIDFHPTPTEALVDGPQALLLNELPKFVEDMTLCHELYNRRKQIYSAS